MLVMKYSCDGLVHSLASLLDERCPQRDYKRMIIGALNAGEPETALLVSARVIMKHGVDVPENLMNEFGDEVELWENDELTELYEDMKSAMSS